MIDFTVPLIGLSLGGAALAAFDLHKRDMRDVLGAVGFFVLGLVLGAVTQAVIPGGILLGGLGGAALGVTRFDEIRRSRLQALEEGIGTADGLAERMLLLHDGLDRVRPNPNWTRRFLGRVVVALLGVVSVVLLLAGLVQEVSGWLLLGGLAAALPAAAWASHKIRTGEYDLLRKALTLCEDEASGVLAEPRTRDIPGERA